MRTGLIIAVLCFCFYGSSAFGQDALTGAGGTSSTTTILDTDTNDSGPIGAIINFINKADAWVQKNLW